MKYEITIIETTPRTLAAAHARANSRNIGDVIGRLLQPVWEFVKENGVEHTGHSIVVYHGEEGDDIFADEGMPIEVGAEVAGSFENTDAVRHFALPGGTVAQTLHRGPYQFLPAAHAAVQHWCLENNREMDGLCWEIYGHHHEDPDRLETWVCYLLR
jgi:effector-binding domain-containing protein